MTRHTITARILATTLMVALSLPSLALAGPEEAAEYYEQASEAYANGDLERAAELLDLAYGEDPSELVYKYNRILALEGMGEYRKALNELTTFETALKKDAKNRFDDIDEIKARLQAQVDEEEKPDEAEDTDETSETEETDASEQPNETPPPEGTQETTVTAEPAGGSNVGSYVLLGSGAVLLGVGGLFATTLFVPSSAKACFFERDCSPTLGEIAEDPTYTADDKFQDAKRVVNTHRAVALSLLGAGTIAAVVGLIMLPPGNSGGADEDVPASAGFDSLRIAPYVAGDGAGAILRLRF